MTNIISKKELEDMQIAEIDYFQLAENSNPSLIASNTFIFKRIDSVACFDFSLPSNNLFLPKISLFSDFDIQHFYNTYKGDIC